MVQTASCSQHAQPLDDAADVYDEQMLEICETEEAKEREWERDDVRDDYKQSGAQYWARRSGQCLRPSKRRNCASR